MHAIRKLGWPLLGAAAGLLLVTTTALAGSGVGGIFNLGELNSVDAQTTLSGNPGANPQLKLVNDGAGAAIRAESQTGIGVNGVSVSGTGQFGQSQSGIGVQGVHTDATGANPGVEGKTNSTDPASAGVVGRNSGGGPGLKAVVNAGAPPLAVNSNVKVANLNADLLDDLEASAFQKRVTGTCAAGSAIKVVNADGSVTCEPVGGGGVWGLTGNAGTTPGTNFLGTTDNRALELKVNGQRTLRLAPATNAVYGSAPNLIGGFPGNAVIGGAVGATIGGGGGPGGANTVGAAASMGTIAGGYGNSAANDSSTVAGGYANTAGALSSAVGGGADNTASGDYSVIAGGDTNTASGDGSAVAGGVGNTAGGFASFAAGRGAKANHDGAFVWADSTGADFASTAINEFAVRAGGGARFVLPFGGFHIEPTAAAPNVIGGSETNAAEAGVVGATIAGGGGPLRANIVWNDFGTVAGGSDNAAGSQTGSAPFASVGGGSSNSATSNYSTVPGGDRNTAAGDVSFAAGRRAKANHLGAFVWADSTDADFASTGNNQFLVRAAGGVKVVRGSNTFLGSTAALLVQNQSSSSGEGARIFQGSNSNTNSVLTLGKQGTSTGNFLECKNFSGTTFTGGKCHIDKDGTFVAGSDFAESLPALGGKAGYEPGDVLSISPTDAGGVIKSRRAFDPAVIGVYSTRPGVLGADKGGITRVGKEEIPVAITGIVPVKVSAENGAIRPGHLLTSSSILGRAMRAGRNPKVGTVLGKSLGFLGRGQGTIRVLVMQR